MSYFLAGLWHFAAAMAFAAAFGVLRNGDPLSWLCSPFFVPALIVSSCALFPIPDRYAKKGPLKFLHYPLPDWDVLFLGPASHRNWLTHSPLIPGLIWLGATRLLGPAQLKLPPEILFPLHATGIGLCVGVGSHLFWDCVGSRNHKIIVVPYWLSFRNAASRIYLLAGAAISLAVALFLQLQITMDLQVWSKN